MVFDESGVGGVRGGAAKRNEHGLGLQPGATRQMALVRRSRLLPSASQGGVDKNDK